MSEPHDFECACDECRPKDAGLHAVTHGEDCACVVCQEAIIEKASAEIDRNSTPEGRRATAIQDAQLYLSGLNSGFRDWNVRNLAREFLSVKAQLELTESRLTETERQRRESNAWLDHLSANCGLVGYGQALTPEGLVKLVCRVLSERCPPPAQPSGPDAKARGGEGG